jgi:putative ABC transport system ATP-binding protein
MTAPEASGTVEDGRGSTRDPGVDDASVAQLVEVTRWYPGESRPALRDVSMTVPRGGFVSITGESGAGKTTLLNILGCLDRPTSGCYRLAGRAVAELAEGELAAVRARWLGFVFQSYRLIEHLTVEQNLEVRFLYGLEPVPADLAETIAATLESLGLAALRGKYPRHLSGGEQQRVAIARTLVRRPLLLLADEPAGNLDEGNTRAVFGLLERIVGLGTAVVVATHDTALAARAGLRLRLVQGRLVDAA